MKTREERLRRREELKRELEKFPKERQAIIMKVVKIAIEQKRIKIALQAGSATSN